MMTWPQDGPADSESDVVVPRQSFRDLINLSGNIKNV